MTRLTRKNGSRIVGMLTAVVSGGMLLGLLPSCETTLTTFNPCGTIFAFCDPYEVDLLFADVPDYGLDPSCTVPYYGLDGEHEAGDCSQYPVYPYTPGLRD